MKYIPLTRHKRAIVDDDDYLELSKHKWSFVNAQTGYAMRMPHKECIYMHRVIMNCPPNKIVDHINHNTLDNRKKNMRICTRKNNQQHMKLRVDNTSGYIGVWHIPNNKSHPWRAGTFSHGKCIPIGNFATKIEAARARDIAAKQKYGAYATLNNI
jgi:hypothetical protein